MPAPGPCTAMEGCLPTTKRSRTCARYARRTHCGNPETTSLSQPQQPVATKTLGLNLTNRRLRQEGRYGSCGGSSGVVSGGVGLGLTGGFGEVVPGWPNGVCCGCCP